MIVVHFKGGLGNQMFQYAAGRALAARHSVPLRFDTRWYAEPQHQRAVSRSFDLPAFRVQGALATDAELAPFAFEYGKSPLARAHARLIRRCGRRTIWRDEAPGRSSAFDRLGREVLLDGYFQHPSYLSTIEGELRDELLLCETPPAAIVRQAERLTETPSVCIQVRRTDFVQNPETAKLHGSCSMEYYQNAWRLVRERIAAARGFVFSDDIEWAREAFRNWADVVVMGPEWNGPAFLHRFFLLRSCRHFIIANSTFGWWAAWLGAKPDSVVLVPRQWLRANEVDALGLRLPSWIAC